MGTSEAGSSPPNQRSAGSNAGIRGDSHGDNSNEINQRFERELDLVNLIARQISKAIDGAVQFDELLAAGRDGLFDAARRFDPTRGVPFRAYANYRVEGAIFDWVRKTLRLPRRAHERLAMMEASSLINQGDYTAALRADNTWYGDGDPESRLSDQLATVVTSAMLSSEVAPDADGLSGIEASANPEEAYERAELMAFVHAALGELDEYEAKAISLYYFEGKTHEEAAESMKVAKSWAHRLHTRAIARLTKRLSFAIRD